MGVESRLAGRPNDSTGNGRALRRYYLYVCIYMFDTEVYGKQSSFGSQKIVVDLANRLQRSSIFFRRISHSHACSIALFVSCPPAPLPLWPLLPPTLLVELGHVTRERHLSLHISGISRSPQRPPSLGALLCPFEAAFGNLFLIQLQFCFDI